MLDKKVTAKTYDRATGKLFLGLGDEESGITTAASIIAFLRYMGQGDPQFEPAIPDNDFIVEFLTLSTKKCNPDPLLVTVAENEEPLTQTKLLAYTTNVMNHETIVNPGKKGESADLKDAAQKITAGIVNIAASNAHAFAAVRQAPDQDENPGQFGDQNSGIALVTITKNGTPKLVQTDAIAGSGTIKRAKPVNPEIDEIKIYHPPEITVPSATLYWDEPLERLYIGMSALRTATTLDNFPAGARSVIVARVTPPPASCFPLTDKLEFAKIAPDSAFDNQGAHDKIVGIIQQETDGPYLVGVNHLRVMHTSTGKSYLIVNGGIRENPVHATAPGNKVFALPLVDVNNPTDPTQGKLADINNPTFTTPAINPGDLLTDSDLDSQVGAGPLPILPDDTITDMVVVGDAVFISTNTTQGIIADPGIFYSQAQFDEAGTIYRWSPWSKRAFPFYKATHGQIKFFDVDAANGKIWAVDAIATNSVVTTNWSRQTDGGVQDQLLERLNCDFCNGSFSALDLDRSTRGLGQSSPARYFLAGGCQQVAFIRTSTSLAKNSPYNLAQDIICDYTKTTSSSTICCNYVLTFSTYYDPITTTTWNTLSAPCCDFVPTLTTATSPPTNPLCCQKTYEYEVPVYCDNIPYGQYVVDNFAEPPNKCFPKNYLLTKLPKNAGCVKVLEYSRRKNFNKNENYFFAGTQSGLYVFAINGEDGFEINANINLLTDPPFSNGKWVKAPNIEGAVIDIKSSGNALYVLTFQTSAQKPLLNKLYKIDFATTVTAMFTAGPNGNIKLIAESATAKPDSDLSAAKMFFAVEMVTTLTSGLGSKCEEQLLLATNNGIYNSFSDSDDFGILQATTQQEARWRPVDPNDTSMYPYLFAIDNTNTEFLTSSTLSTNAVTTVWPTQVADEKDCLTFEKSIVRQLSGSRRAIAPDYNPIYAYDPENFNSTYPPCSNKDYYNYCACPPYYNVTNKFATYNPISYFWTDGARRFFIIKRAGDPNWVNKLFVIPYDIKEWMINDPAEQELTDPELQQVETFYWLKHVGVSGTLLAGTDSGVIALD